MKKVCSLLFIVTCMLMGAQTTPGKHLIKISNVNTKQADFGVNFMGDDKVIFASPNDKVTIVRRVWRENGQPYLDLYIGDIDSIGNIVNKRKLEGEVNRKLHEASVAFTKDLKTVYFSANNYSEKQKSIRGKEGFDNIQLYKAVVNDAGEWNNIEKLPFNSDDYNTGLPSLSKDDKKLYFASDRPGGFGKTDIYVVDIMDSGYSDPKNLGPRINTEEREMFPFIADDNILYFSSNGHPGYGNLDVFASKIFDNTVSESLNLEEPINSPKDDFAYILKNEKNKGYFSSNRGNGKGDDDIYSFAEDEELFIDCLQEIKGVVRDKDTKELIPGAIVQVIDANGKQLQITAAKEDDASYSFLIPCNNEITLVGTTEGYLKEERPLKTLNDLDTEAIVENLDMTPEFIMVGDELLININVIYFDFDKSNIRPDAAAELDKVVEVMEKYPELDIFATSHTDSRGGPKYNMRLSDRRAKSTVDYILSKGIDAERIKSEGK
ncbi:MAG: OmpA family protein, partial [Flavobacteriaceae bacterium]|nr:OmpA family protein [Flavobacteriaceae bacterium]